LIRYRLPVDAVLVMFAGLAFVDLSASAHLGGFCQLHGEMIFYEYRAA
jgi:hypothetical protein